MNSIETILLENIDKPNSLFIFPTDISASRWADHLLRLKSGSGSIAVSTIAMNKFSAWDKFKQNSIKSKVLNKKSIPSALRKIFVSRLLHENAGLAAKGEAPLFSSLIKIQWAQQASQFTPWLTDILPQLGVWLKKKTGLSADEIKGGKSLSLSPEFTGDDSDIFTLVCRYAQFLEAHSLFEPAWETPPFVDDGREVFVFFPESLSDYSEYRELLSASNHVRTINIPCTGNSASDTFFYTNSRSEITEASLYIRALHEKKDIAWDSIAVSIPDVGNYEPYVLREFANRNIPYVKRTSKPLSDYPASGFFRSVLDCVSQDFSFSSVVSLIRNKNLPWKDNETIDKLVQFGIDNNCIYSWTETGGEERKVNVWEDAFDRPFGYYGGELRSFFTVLKKRISGFRYAGSFADIARQYFILRDYFFDMEKCGEETDLVLSRCISELMSLTELEKSFPDVPAVDPFLFFTEHLSEIYYLPQSKLTGVAILPYKTAAAAPFDCHIILGAGQDNLSVVYSRLVFLPKKKREELGIADEDASLAFINMHKCNSVKISAFFCCEKSFSGFTIPHSKINSPSGAKERYAEDPEHSRKFSEDYYKTENIIYSSLPAQNKRKINRLHERQIKGFTEWKNRRFELPLTAASINGSIIKNNFKNEEIQRFIINSFAKTGKYSVSATSLQKYYQCSLKWLFERVFMLENLRIETSLMPENISGIVYHAIINDFFKKLINKTLAENIITDSVPSLPAFYRGLLYQSIDAIFDCFPSLAQDETQIMSSLSARLLSAGKSDYQYHLENCISHFLAFFAGCTVIGTESNYITERETYIMRGYIDCVLKDSSGKYIIVDFKLKNTPSRSGCVAEGETPLSDFQLPMYITLTEENEKFKVYTALFYSILDHNPEVIIGAITDEKTEKVFPDISDQIIRDSEWYNRIFNDFKNKTEKFVQDISTGNYSVYPQNSNDCLNCDYQRICRTVYIIDRENIFLGNS